MRSHFSFEKRRKELEKKKKKEAKRQARAERKAAKKAGEEIVDPEVKVDEFGNVVEVAPDEVRDVADLGLDFDGVHEAVRIPDEQLEEWIDSKVESLILLYRTGGGGPGLTP